MAIRTRFCAQWESFRNLLSNGQRDNLSALVNAELVVGNLKNGRQRIIIVTPAPTAAVTVLMWKDELFLVGGHWIRQGEPTEAYVKMIQKDAAKIRNGTLK